MDIERTGGTPRDVQDEEEWQSSPTGCMKICTLMDRRIGGRVSTWIVPLGSSFKKAHFFVLKLESFYFFPLF